MSGRETILLGRREEAYTAACESCSPNSPEFEALLERLEESYQQPWLRYFDLRDEGYSMREASLMAGLSDPQG